MWLLGGRAPLNGSGRTLERQMMKLPDTTRDAATLAPFPSVAQFTREEAISRSTVARLATAGLIRVIKTGRNARVDRQSWYDYLNSRHAATYRVSGRQERA
jgi:hypothetical protein